MLGSALPASAYTHDSAAATTTLQHSPPRTSRLRGLSYLRSYGHRDTAPAITRTTSSPVESRPATTAATSSDEADRTVASAAQRQTEEGGWVPTVQGTPVMTRPRAATSVEATPTESSTSTTPAERRAQNVSSGATATPSSSAPPTSGPPHAAPATDSPSSSRDSLPTIRLIPHVELRSSRPSLQFTAVSRTLKQPTNIVRVGRYSERDTVITPEGSVHPVGFKSKVVSRRHCEFWCTEGQWYIRDVKSSSGTFLNHVRLSAPGAESRPFPVNDGDVVQLGIDFKGGEELIFRCVKIRVECNRGWQKGLNSFNTSAHRRLLKSALRGSGNSRNNRDSDAASTHSSECSICLNPVAPCQALFVAPCSHVWHYKCVRNLVQGPNYPNFLCPNCRYVADLDADVEPMEDGDLSSHESDEEEEEEEPSGNGKAPEVLSNHRNAPLDQDDDEMELDLELERENEATTTNSNNLSSILAKTTLSPSASAALAAEAWSSSSTNTALSPPPQISSSTTRRPQHPPRSTSNNNTSTTQPVDIQPNNPANTSSSSSSSSRNNPGSPSSNLLSSTAGITDGPMTPRNDAGPFVLDGGASGAGGAGAASGGAARALQSITGTVANGGGGSGRPGSEES